MTLGVGTLPMKAQLIVVQGKPEGKTIPLALPQFKIGRGEGCQLRPNNDQVSREHAMFEVTSDSVFVQDLGQPQRHRAQRQEADGPRVDPAEERRPGQGRPADLRRLDRRGRRGRPRRPRPGRRERPASLDDMGHEDIGSWLVSDASQEPPDQPFGRLWRRDADDRVVQGQGEAGFQGRHAQPPRPRLRRQGPSRRRPSPSRNPSRARGSRKRSSSTRRTTGSRISRRRSRPRCPRNSSTSRTPST